MAPIIPTHRPLVTPLRIAAATVVVAILSALLLLAHQPARADGLGFAMLCAPAH